jgi:hypothetical protein
MISTIELGTSGAARELRAVNGFPVATSHAGGRSPLSCIGTCSGNEHALRRFARKATLASSGAASKAAHKGRARPGITLISVVCCGAATADRTH